MEATWIIWFNCQKCNTGNSVIRRKQIKKYWNLPILECNHCLFRYSYSDIQDIYENFNFYCCACKFNSIIPRTQFKFSNVDGEYVLQIPQEVQCEHCNKHLTF